MRTDENEHVEVHEVRGFVAETIADAMQEAYALSKGTRCKQYLFSLSLNPPETENVPIETFEHAIAAIEERLGLTGQPRMIVFHEKEGRRHAHAVWSRIDANTMTAKPLPFFKTKLQDVSRQLFLENGWKMPRGLIERGAGDPRNFTLDEWQRSKRLGVDPKQLKGLVQQCWAASDNRKAFESALEERGLFLARGDRRGRVIMTHDGEIQSLSRALGRKEKELSAKLGHPDSLKSIDDARRYISATISPRVAELVKIAKRNTAQSLKPLLQERLDLAARHRDERKKLDAGLSGRWGREVRERASRLRKGLAGLWDRLSGERSKAIARNELEAVQALRRDRAQRDRLVNDQLREREKLQANIKAKRRDGAALVLALLSDATRLRRDGHNASPTMGQEFSQQTRGNGRSRRSGRDHPTLDL